MSEVALDPSQEKVYTPTLREGMIPLDIHRGLLQFLLNPM